MGSRIAAHRVVSMGLLFILVVIGFRACRPTETRDESNVSEEQTPDYGPGRTIPPDVLAAPAGLSGPGVGLDHGHWYVPYGVLNEAQAIAMVQALTVELLKGNGFPDTLTVPEGIGARGENVFYPSVPGVARMYTSDINNREALESVESTMPLVISQPAPGDGAADVLFVDGHLASVRMGTFPLSPGFLKALAALDTPEYAEKSRAARGG